jgi:predicted PhzF superfamily epimerase YddE/YHI9
MGSSLQQMLSLSHHSPNPSCPYTWWIKNQQQLIIPLNRQSEINKVTYDINAKRAYDSAVKVALLGPLLPAFSPS